MGKIILRLDRMMVERKISLNELAERVGISNVNLSKIKNNNWDCIILTHDQFAKIPQSEETMFEILSSAKRETS